MSDNLPPTDPAVCPIDPESLAPASRKFVAGETPKKMKMMAAKGIIPMPPSDMVQVLFMLTFDADEEVQETARAATAGLSEKILTPVLRGDLPASVLDFLADSLIEQEQHLEQILLNPAATDATFVRLAAQVKGKSLNLIAQNQLRLLREPDIIRGLARNPEASQATLDSVFDFAVRSGLNLPDVQAFQEARRRILGDAAVDAETEPDPEETAEGLIAAHADALAEEHDAEAPPPEETEGDEQRETITQKIMRMTVSEKIKMAMLGNKEARTILLRDSNKLVQEAVVQSPRITEGEIIALTNSRTIPDAVLRYILSKRDLMAIYAVKVNLVSNPKLQLALALRMLPQLKPPDIRALSRNRNVPQALRNAAKKLMEKKSSSAG
ncbi:MAG: hypothetical protein P1V51_22565 [Deltaproteobacteria bacterium]|nr:hypothetical protein [Deltaproteobacteria bacterium]